MELVQYGTVIETGTFNGTTATLNFSGVVSPGNGTATYQVVVTFASSAPTGNYQFSVTSGTGTNGQQVQFANLPVYGAIVQIVSATATFTATATVTFTAIFTPTAQATSTFTTTSTSTVTSTPTSNKGVVVYPNPVTSPTVNIFPPTYSGVSNVEVEIFTLAFRKVLDETFPNVPAGTPLKITLDDQWGHPLANGLYYVVVIVNGERSIAKLLILR